MNSDIEEQIKRGLSLENEGEFLAAKKIYNQILNDNADNPDALNLLALLEYKKENYAQAASLIKKAAELKPCLDFYKNLGEIYIHNNDFFNAIENYKKALKLSPEDFGAWFNLAFSLKSNGQVDDAITAYEKALLINPDSPDVYHNLGNIYSKIKNDPVKTIEYFRKFLELEPDNTDAKSNLGALYLKIKNYKEGWKYLEFCINKAVAVVDRNSPNSPTRSKPLWRGEDIKDKTIYVYYDGGLGDTIMFARFLPLLEKKCPNVVLGLQPEIIPLLKENGINMKYWDVTNKKDKLDFDVHIPIMSLPHKLNINSEKDIPSPQGYFKANPQKIKEYKKYFNTNKFKIGIKWQGDTVLDTTRKIPLKSFYKIFNLPNVQFYSLQKGGGIEQLPEAQKKYNIVDLGSTFNDFSDTAAAIQNLDLVITNDTSVAHLAGAMGKTCWVLLPMVQDWRWSVDISYCPWYKSIRLFKQEGLSNWDELFDRVYKELKNYKLV